MSIFLKTSIRMFQVYFDCLNEKVEIQLSQEHEKLTCGSFTIASGTLETI